MNKIKNNTKYKIIKNIVKKIFSIFIIFSLLFLYTTNLVGAKKGESKDTTNKLTSDDKYNYEKYLKNVKEKCGNYKPKKPSFRTEEFPDKVGKFAGLQIKDKGNLFQAAKTIYRNNQNSIYKCSIIKVQQNSFTLVKNKLLTKDKTGDVISRVKKDIEFKESKLKSLTKKAKCKITEKNKIFSKKDILNETTYQLCKYTFYLEYLKKYYNNLERATKVTNTQKQTQNYNIQNIINAHSRIQTDIKNEKYHSYKIYELAFQAYVEYEDTLPQHILLELIKQDFIVYREKLHKTINPLNQVLYKIVNAMSK